MARVFDAELTLEEVVELMPQDLSAEDSTTFVQNYINAWAKNQVILHKAEYNLVEDQKNFEKLIEDNRNDLLKFAYQQEVIKKYLDTNITPEEIAEYYEQHAQDFELKENIIKASYVRFNKKTPKLGDAKKWFFNGKEKDKERFMEYTIRYSNLYNFNDTTWMSFEDLAKIVPIQTYNQQQFLSQNRQAEVQDSAHVYWLKFTGYKIKDNASPLTYVEKTIKNIIINQRKLEVVKEMENNLLKEAIEKRDFEIY